VTPASGVSNMHPTGEQRTKSDDQELVRGEWHRPLVAIVVVAAVLAVLFVGMVGLPRELASLPAIARHAMRIALPVWGTTEAVNEIVYGSRGFDTFGETFLLLAAVMSVVTLSRSREPRHEYVGESSAGIEEQRENDPGGDAAGQEEEARSAERKEEHGSNPLPDPDSIPLGEPAPEQAGAMSVVVRVAARPAAILLSVAGVYLAAWGYTPGGGFPAGAALTGVAVLLYAALGHRAVSRFIRPSVLEPVEMVGGAAIVAVGLLGLFLQNSMFANWLPLAPQQTIRAGGTTQLYSGGELVEVATGLTIAIFALLGMGHDWTPDQDEDEGEQ
jgi:multicomponent Na+:H+ antiporter subunit B